MKIVHSALRFQYRSSLLSHLWFPASSCKKRNCTRSCFTMWTKGPKLSTFTDPDTQYGTVKRINETIGLGSLPHRIGDSSRFFQSIYSNVYEREADKEELEDAGLIYVKRDQRWLNATDLSANFDYLPYLIWCSWQDTKLCRYYSLNFDFVANFNRNLISFCAPPCVPFVPLA